MCDPIDGVMPLNWKDRGDGRYDALASRDVGGKYFIEWIESYYSEYRCEYVEVRAFRVDYQTKGGGGIGNVSRTRIRTLEQAKRLAEFHHQKLKELINAYNGYRNVPSEAWSQFSRELLAWEEHALLQSLSDGHAEMRFEQGGVVLAQRNGESVP